MGETALPLSTEQLLDHANTQLCRLHGLIWPDDWRDFLRAWAHRGVSYTQQSHLIAKIWDVDVSKSTVRNLHKRLDEAA